MASCDSRLGPLLALCRLNTRIHILRSRLVRPLTPFGNLVAVFRGYRWRPRHGGRRIGYWTSGTFRVGSGPCQVKAEACRVRYPSALTKRRPRIVASVAGCPHGGLVTRVGDGTRRFAGLPDGVGGPALHKPVSARSRPGGTSFQTVPRTQRQRPTSPDEAGSAVAWTDMVETQNLVRLSV